MICRECEYIKKHKRFGNARGECMCGHPRAVKTFKKVCPRSPRMEGFIGYTIAGTMTPATKTAPRWCPLKESNHD